MEAVPILQGFSGITLFGYRNGFAEDSLIQFIHFTSVHTYLSVICTRDSMDLQQTHHYQIEFEALAHHADESIRTAIKSFYGIDVIGLASFTRILPVRINALLLVILISDLIIIG